MQLRLNMNTGYCTTLSGDPDSGSKLVYINYGDCKLETSNYNSPGFVISICTA